MILLYFVLIINFVLLLKNIDGAKRIWNYCEWYINPVRLCDEADKGGRGGEARRRGWIEEENFREIPIIHAAMAPGIPTNLDDPGSRNRSRLCIMIRSNILCRYKNIYCLSRREIEAFLAWNLTKHKTAFLVASARIAVVLTAWLFATQRSHANVISSAIECRSNPSPFMCRNPFFEKQRFTKGSSNWRNNDNKKKLRIFEKKIWNNYDIRDVSEKKISIVNSDEEWVSKKKGYSRNFFASCRFFDSG